MDKVIWCLLWSFRKRFCSWINC